MMSNDGGVPGPGGQESQEPQDPQHPGQGVPGGDVPGSGPSFGSGQPERPQPQYGQYAPPGYQAPVPAPTGNPAPWSPPSVGDSHGFAWRSFGRNAGVWIVMALLVGAVAYGAFFAANPWYFESVNASMEAALAGDQAATLRAQQEMVEQTASTSFVLVNALVGLVTQIIGMTFYAAGLASTRARKIGFGDFFALRNWAGIGGYALIVTLVSLVAALIPVLGTLIQMAVMLFLVAAPYFILGPRLNAFEAIAASAKLVASNVGVVIVAVLLAIAYTIAGACACGLGLLVVLPFSAVFGAHLFRRLRGESIEADQGPTWA